MKRTTRLTFDHQLTFATIRRKRRGRWLFLALLLLLVGGVAAYTVARELTRRPPEPFPSAMALPTVAPAIARPAAAKEPSGSKVQVVVQRTDTIERIFSQLKLSGADLKTLLDIPGVGQSFIQLKPGDKLTVVHDGAVLQAIDRRISETEVLSVTRGENGFAAERIITWDETKPPQVLGSDRSS